MGMSPLVTQITWTNNLMILSKTKSMEELCLQKALLGSIKNFIMELGKNFSFVRVGMYHIPTLIQKAIYILILKLFLSSNLCPFASHK